jgi:hypothetical protein
MDTSGSFSMKGEPFGGHIGWDGRIYVQFNIRTYTNDPFTRVETFVPTLELAILYCRQQGLIYFIISCYIGFGYVVKYPKWRNTSRQTYVDNFKWKGFDIEDPDQ